METKLNGGATRTQINVVNQSFLWMFVGLVVTGITSIFVAASPVLLNAIYSNNILFFGLIIVELALVFILSSRVQKMSFGTAVISYTVYSILNGVTLSSIFLIYAGVSIASIFFVTALVFGIMAFYGYKTGRDLTTIGNLALMALIGIVIASLANLFFMNDTFSLILSWLSIAIFICLTAYDTQKIKRMESYSDNQNLGILGALTLYLDFINIFLDLLRIFGRKRNE